MTARSRRLVAAAGLLALVIGVPLLLLETSGAPGLHGLPDLEGLRRAIELRWVPVEWAIRVLALAAWALWAYLVLAILLRLAGAAEARLATGGRLWAASEAFTWAPVKLLVDVSLGAILLSGTIGNDQVSAAARPSGWSAAAAPHVAAIRDEEGHGRVEPPKKEASRRERDRAAVAPDGEYVVRPGDSLWAIAERELDDPYRWEEIWRLNEGRAMPDGQRLSRPGFVRPGWRLRLPEVRNGETGPCNDGGVNSDASSGTKRGRARQRNALHHGLGRDQYVGDPSLAPAPIEHRHLHQNDRVELPSGTAVAVGFIAGLVTALGLYELRERRRRAPRPLRRGWPSASSGRELKTRLLRRIARDGDVDSGKQDVDSILREWEPDSVSILLGHREGSPVVASLRSDIYGFTGNSRDIHSYFRDLALNTLVSNPAVAEVWAIGKFGYEDIERLRVFDNPRSLVSELEVEVIKRHRLFDEEDVTDWDAHQDAWPDDRLQLLLALLPQCEEGLDNRLGAVAAQGQDLGIFVFRGDPVGGAIAIDGRTLLPERHMTTIVGEGPFEAIAIADTDRPEILRALAPVPEQPDARDDAEPVQVAPTRSKPAEGVPIKVRLFGAPEIVGMKDDQPDGFGPKSREFLFYFLLHPQGATREQAIEALWPETDIAKGIDKFWFQMRTVRNHLRNDDAPTAKFIDKYGDTYRAKPELFDVDLWEFDRLIAEAARGKDIRRNLAAAADLYRGDLFQGIYYSWSEPLQAHFRNQFSDAMVQLSKACSVEGDDEAAIEALFKAIAADRYAEHLYRTIMRLHARLGRRNDVERVYKELEAVLADELEAEPDPETDALKNQLLTQGVEGRGESATS